MAGPIPEAEFIQATRASYNTVAAHYTARFLAELEARPLDRALLAGFAELVRAAGAAPIADIGCGPGRVTAYLNELGSPAFGIDLSPEMVAQARHAYPRLRFQEGSMLALDLPVRSLGGIVAWYSIIHVPDEQLPQAVGQFRRVLIPGGYLLIAFLAGNEVHHHANIQAAADLVIDTTNLPVIDVAERIAVEADKHIASFARRHLQS